MTQDTSKQPFDSTTVNVAASNDRVRAFTSQLTVHWQLLQSSLILEFEKQISVLQEENQTLRQQLLVGIDIKSAPQPHEQIHLNVAQDTRCEERIVDIDDAGFSPSQPGANDENTSADVSDTAEDPSSMSTVDNAQDILATSDPDPSSMGTVKTSRPRNSIIRAESSYRRAPPMLGRHEHPMHELAHHGVYPSSEEHTWLQNLVFSKPFEAVSSGVILLNTVVMAMSMQYDGFEAGHDLEWRLYSPSVQTWPWFKGFNDYASIIFNTLFCIELLLRIVAVGKHACCHSWIWFDMIVVSMSMIDLVFPPGTVPVNPGMMRVMRLARLVRLLKLLKTMTAFDSLFLLLKSLRASMHAAMWSFLVLATVQLMMGLFLCQILHDYIKDDENPLEVRKEIFGFFGSFSRTMLTMFQITFSNWIVPCRLLMEKVNEWFMLLFIAYRCFFCFAVLRVISAVFITETNRVLMQDDELTFMKKRRDKLLLTRKVHSLVESIDPNNEGSIDWNTFEIFSQDEELARLLIPLGFEIHDMEKLFWLLQNGKGSVVTEEFLSKVGRLRGGAKSIEAQTLIKIAHQIDEALHTFLQKQGYIKGDDGMLQQIESKACAM